jgi:hypothetical protein
VNKHKNGGCGAETPTIVMAGLDPAIQQHIENTHFLASWMAGSKPGQDEACG